MLGWVHIGKWFRPAAEPCLLCGQWLRSSPSERRSVPVRMEQPRRVLMQLCDACMASIPWIRRPICLTCGRAEACGDCARRRETHFVRSRSAVRYDASMKAWLALYKYRGHERLELLLSAMLAFAFERMCLERGVSVRQASSYFHAVVSVPLADERLEERGFNQADRMASALARWYGLKHEHLLSRLHHTEKQSLKSRRSRMLDMQGNFALSASSGRLAVLRSSELRRIVLIDDIFTTGSTMNECARVLRMARPSFAESDIQVYGVLWARS
ncbi:ComF family protein [Cohnella faecalis]|uniref:ComF family protein n=1 Tax=Cohnella faecalis TaxID=2315694 RepID=A0A398CI72_9BACL|nr:ComF family protein [Cohnella faecalis]RIE02055.1 ComF family protein [Cohnella faecalis]